MKSTTLQVGPSPEGADQPQNTGSFGSLIEATGQTSAKENQKNSVFALAANGEITRANTALQTSSLQASYRSWNFTLLPRFANCSNAALMRN